MAFDKSVDVLKDYFALLFPTYYYTEGIPGTIIDAYAAGVPVISARWANYNDICRDNVTAIGYTMGEENQLNIILSDVLNNISNLLEMRRNCIAGARNYLPREAVSSLLLRMD